MSNFLLNVFFIHVPALVGVKAQTPFMFSLSKSNKHKVSDKHITGIFIYVTIKELIIIVFPFTVNFVIYK